MSGSLLEWLQALKLNYVVLNVCLKLTQAPAMQPSASQDVRHDDSGSYGHAMAAVPNHHPSRGGVMQQGNSQDDSAHGMP